jgi:hypothetical protein
VVRALYRALIFMFDMEVDAFEVVVNSGMDLGVRCGQVRWPAKSPTASRWRLDVEPPEEDEGICLLFFLINESVSRFGSPPEVGWAAAGYGCWAAAP